MTGRITLAPKLDLRASQELARQIAALRGADVALDASDVRNLGAHAVQTLLVAAEPWSGDGRTLSIGAPSDAFRDDLAQFGLTETAFEGRPRTWALPFSPSTTAARSAT